MVIIETPIFKKCIEDIATEEEYRTLQNDILENPESGKLIKGGGGIRKIRFATGGKGKSGGARAIYFYIKPQGQVLMLIAYAKSVSDTLTADQVSLLKELVKAL